MTSRSDPGLEPLSDSAEMDHPATPESVPSIPIGLSRDDAVITGLAGGVAERLGIAPVYVRAAFVSLTLVWGAGVVLYLAAVAATAGQEPGTPVAPVATGSQRRGLALIGAGVLLFFRAINLWPGDVIVWPFTALIFGAAFLIDQRELNSREAISSFLHPGDGGLRPRTLIGVGLALAGIIMLGTAAVPQVGVTLLAVIVTGIGFVLLFGPWMWGLVSALSNERNERVRQEERAEMAAHLHDSVLQTLALIQRTDDPKRMMTLARGQERELRRWLYEKTPDSADDLLSDAIAAVAARIEDDFDVVVELVTVGDMQLVDSSRALVSAAGEALINAAKHAKTSRLSVFSEVTDESVDIYITDQGVGFDLSAVNQQRRGISDSIVGRMTRHGGTAEIISEPGEGTEVHLAVPRES